MATNPHLKDPQTKAKKQNRPVSQSEEPAFFMNQQPTNRKTMNNVIPITQPVTPASTAREVPFEIVENPPELNPEIRPKGLLLHCGAQVVDRQYLFEVATPHGSKTWYPLPHRSLVTEVETQLQAAGFQLRGESHALTHDGQRYFGVIQVNLPNRNDRDFGWVVGLRNSHDKSLPAGLVAGTQVFVCDNLAFNGEVKLSRKHTRFAMRDLKQLTARAVGKLGDKFADFDRRVTAYKRHYLPDRSAHGISPSCRQPPPPAVWASAPCGCAG